jgi:hypothetical protein
MINTARELRVRLYPIGFGENLNTPALVQMAAETGGHYYPAANLAELHAVLAEAPGRTKGQLAIDLERQIVLTYLSLFQEGQHTYLIRGNYNGLEGFFEEDGVFATGGDIRAGQLVLRTSGVDSSGHAEVFLRTEYVPRNISQFRFRFILPMPYKVELVDRGLLANGWLLIKEPLADGDGSLNLVSQDAGGDSWTLADEAFGGIELGPLTKPAFADVDGNGVLDLVVGAGDGSVWLVEGEAGGFAEPVPLTVETLAEQGEGLPPQLVAQPIDVGTAAAPAYGDLDADGDADLIAGAGDGSVWFYEKAASTVGADYLAPVPLMYTTPGGSELPIDAGAFSAPALADIDLDGDLDLYVGNAAGNLNVYENTGAASAPVFSPPRQLTYVFVDQTGAGFELTAPLIDYSAPSFGDKDGDGDLDLFIGGKAGQLVYLENTPYQGAPAFRTPQTVAHVEGSVAAAVSVGAYSAPAAADLTGDGRTDLLVGEEHRRNEYTVLTTPDNALRYGIFGELLKISVETPGADEPVEMGFRVDNEIYVNPPFTKFFQYPDALLIEEGFTQASVPPLAIDAGFDPDAPNAWDRDEDGASDYLDDYPDDPDKQ